MTPTTNKDLERRLGRQADEVVPPAPRRRQRRGQIAQRRTKRKDVRVVVTITLPGFERESLEVRNYARDLVRELVAHRMPRSSVEQRASVGIVITDTYHGPALNAGALTAAAWLLQTLDECVPEDSPLSELIARGGVGVTTKVVR